MKTRDQEVEDIKKDFEANMLDGQDVFDCGKSLLSAQSVFEYISEKYTIPSCSCEKLVPLDYMSVRKNIRFYVEHLVTKVTNPDDYISKQKRTEGHIDAIAGVLCDTFGTKPIVVPSEDELRIFIQHHLKTSTPLDYIPSERRDHAELALSAILSRAIHAMLSKEVK